MRIWNTVKGHGKDTFAYLILALARVEATGKFYRRDGNSRAKEEQTRGCGSLHHGQAIRRNYVDDALEMLMDAEEEKTKKKMGKLLLDRRFHKL